MIIFEFDVSFGGHLGQIIPIISACLRFYGATFSIQIFLMPLWVVFSLHGTYSWMVDTTWEEFLGFVTIITFSPVRQLIQNSSQCSLDVLFFYCTKKGAYLSCVTWMKNVIKMNESQPLPSQLPGSEKFSSESTEIQPSWSLCLLLHQEIRERFCAIKKHPHQ